MAMAPEQTGIGIRRHLTTEGVDPYDEVVWERRDARITNYRDGTVAFEQRGVEFPVTWSQNAANIVTQKYFRGPLGTPERESSLRQVVDRVADTITAWGVKDGYFVDAEEAEAFRAELKHLVVHQKAAFNSPVWFNIGVNGEPQQASACQPYDALVSTPEGMVPIGKLVEDRAVGTKVYDAHGITMVVAVRANGRKPVLRLHTKAGYTLDVTGDHLVWRAGGTGPGRFVPAGQLRIGDRVTWHRRTSWGDGEITRTAVAEAALAGWLQADGFVGRYEGTNRPLTIEATTVTEAERTWVLDAIDRAFPEVRRHERPVASLDQRLDCRRTRLYGEPLRDFVERWDLGVSGTEMTAPASLFTAPLPVVAAYLRSLFQAEGYVSLRERGSVVGLAMLSEQLVRGIQSLLLRFGIFSRVRFAPDTRADRKGCWVLAVRSAGDRRRFADEIGFVDPVKAEKLEASFVIPGLPAHDSRQLEIASVEALGEADVYDIQTASGEYLSGGMRVHNCFILAVEDTMRSILNWYVEEGTIFKGGSGSGINLSNIRSSYEQLKGGGTASGPVSFMRGADASAGTIKSGGKTRRAAKMVILNADHPDIEDFIWCKAVEERKARVLRDAGFDMDLDGKDSHSTQYQNANNSVRVTDDFMQAVLDDADWPLRAVTTGEPIRVVKARQLFRQIAEATWECADPGMQFDTTINRWHTAANTGPINGSNPCCFTGETLVDTSDGLIPFDLLYKTGEALLQLPDATSFDVVTGTTVRKPISRVWIAGRTDRLLEVRTQRGIVVRCTPEHRFLTLDHGYVEARSLAVGDSLRAVSLTGVEPDDLVASVVPLVLPEPVAVYDLEVGETHNFAVSRESTDLDHSLVVHNSEYMHLDNSACNLASLNLLKFLNDDGSFDVEGFKAAVEVVFTAQEILVGNADYPTEKIGENARRFRQLGLGYANLGAMLMALGIAYDSDAGRTWAAAITSLMTGHAYATSARTAARMGPFAGYSENREPMNRVLRMHRDEASRIDDALATRELVSAAHDAWDRAVEWADDWGVRNSQASVLAPTGCLVGGSLVATDRGLVRLGSLGDPDGEQWQDLGVQVATDEGARTATRFYVNGLEPVVAVETVRGYRVQGTTQHRVKVVDETTGAWAWTRLADVTPGDLVPLALHQLVGEPRPVPLPPLPEPYWTGEHHLEAPRTMSPELAELLGYFMGDGSLHARGLRFCVAETDFDVVGRLERLGKELFGASATVTPRTGYTEVGFPSVRLTLWWEACGFAKLLPDEGPTGKGSTPHIPSAVLHANDPEVYRAFLRGLFEAGGTVTAGVPSFSSTALEFSRDVQSLLLALGYPASRKLATTRTGWGQAPIAVLRLLNASYAGCWAAEIGFVGSRKHASLTAGDATHAGRHDHVPLSRAMVDRLAPGNDRLRRALLTELSRGRVSRRGATELFERTGDPELGHLLSFFYDRVASAELGDEELTYDLSVPDNVTYVANGFVSHNTIGLMMDCDTTGIEPDLGLCKTKKLVGGGTMSIVNQTVPRALRRLGYSPLQVQEVVAYIDEHKSIMGAPHLSADHLSVFACSMGDNVIHYLGHIRMMAAVQPWISGAISKCVTGDTLLATADGLVRIGSLYGGEAPDSFRHEIREVASTNGTQKTDAFYYGGVRPVRTVALGSGHRVTGTPNHRLQVAAGSGLEWRRLDEIGVGEYVATQYGSELWAVLPPRFDDFRPSASYGSQKRVRMPQEMTEELAFLLGAYASGGHTTVSNWTITITSSVDAVLERVAAAWRSELGVEARIVRRPNRCPGVVVASKTVVELLQHLGCGLRASAKRIPDAVLRSPRHMVLAFMQGLALDADVSVRTMPRWAICLDAPAMLDDLQAVLTNLGIVHGRTSKLHKTDGKTYDEVHATGDHARRLVELVPFLEPQKSARAAELRAMAAGRSSADVVPGISLRELHALIPKGHRAELSFLHDVRTNRVSRRTVEQVAALPGVRLPEWLRTVLDDDLHFSPVASVVDGGDREVFDISVPATSAFVGNGIVNHNTINVPESVTVDEMEQLHIDAWRMGLKAVAVYRDNCKVAQPLSTTKKETAPVVQPVLVKQPVRERLPRMRSSKTFSFRVADCHGYVTVGEYDDGRPGEIFLRVAKQGSTLAGIMDAFAISVSHGLQYGVPLRAFVDMYTNMRFEPAGITDDTEIRFASSLVDYIFRRLAVEYLPLEDRVDLGILTVGERMQPTLPGVEEQVTPTSTGTDVVPDPAPPAPTPVAQSTPSASDAPYCYQCGVVMQRAGACFVCTGCGTTSGCS